MNKAKLKKWLKDNGHKSADIDALKLDTVAEMRKAIYKLHGIQEKKNV
jgi:hypothetical protein